MNRSKTLNRNFSKNVGLIGLYLILFLSSTTSSDNIIREAQEKYLITSSNIRLSIDIKNLTDKNHDSCFKLSKDTKLNFKFNKNYLKSTFSYAIDAIFKGNTELSAFLGYNDTNEVPIKDCRINSSHLHCIIEDQTIQKITFSHASSKNFALCELSIETTKEKLFNSNNKISQKTVLKKQAPPWLIKAKKISFVMIALGLTLCLFSVFTIGVAIGKRREYETKIQTRKFSNEDSRTTSIVKDLPTSDVNENTINEPEVYSDVDNLEPAIQIYQLPFNEKTGKTKEKVEISKTPKKKKMLRHNANKLNKPKKGHEKVK